MDLRRARFVSYLFDFRAPLCDASPLLKCHHRRPPPKRNPNENKRGRQADVYITCKVIPIYHTPSQTATVQQDGRAVVFEAVEGGEWD